MVFCDGKRTRGLQEECPGRWEDVQAPVSSRHDGANRTCSGPPVHSLRVVLEELNENISDPFPSDGKTAFGRWISKGKIGDLAGSNPYIDITPTGRGEKRSRRSVMEEWHHLSDKSALEGFDG